MSKLILVAVGSVVVAGAGVATYHIARSKQPPIVSSPSPTPSLNQLPTPAPLLAASHSPGAKSLVMPSTSLSPVVKPSQSPGPSPKNDNEPLLLLKGVGINLDYYDPSTGKAGDLVFTKDKLQFDVLFTEFGFTIPADSSATGKAKRNPQPTWQAPMGTKVHAIVDGVVTNVSTLYSNDYTIMVATDKNSRWQYETEHVSNPLVKVGDQVVAGQVIAEVSPHNKDGNSGYGLVEIGLLKGGNPPSHVCPFAYLDPSVKDDIQKKLLAFYKAWEEYRGNPNLYDESAQPTPGCLTSDPIDG